MNKKGVDVRGNQVNSLKVESFLGEDIRISEGVWIGVILFDNSKESYTEVFTLYRNYIISILMDNILKCGIFESDKIC